MGIGCSCDGASVGTARSRARDTARARRTAVTAFDAIDSKAVVVPSVHEQGGAKRRASAQTARRVASRSNANHTRAEAPRRISGVHQSASATTPDALNDTAPAVVGLLESPTQEPMMVTNNPLRPLNAEPLVSEQSSTSLASEATDVTQAVTTPLPPQSASAGAVGSTAHTLPLRALGSDASDAHRDDNSSPLHFTTAVDAAARRRRLSIMAPSTVDADFQQASGYSSLTSPLANLIRVHDCFSSSQNPSKGSEGASGALKSLTMETFDHNNSVAPTPQPPQFTRAQSPPRTSQHQPPPRGLMSPDTSVARSRSSGSGSGVIDVPFSHNYGPVALGRRATELASTGPTVVVSSQRRSGEESRGGGGSNAALLQRGGSGGRSVVASTSPSHFSPVKKTMSGSEATIVEMLKNIEHLSKFDLKGLVQQFKRSGIFRVFDRPLSNPRYNQFVADTLYSLCMTRMLVLRTAIRLGFVTDRSEGRPSSASATTDETKEGTRDKSEGYEDLSALLPSDRKVVAEMVSTNAINHALNDLHEILSDEQYTAGRTWDDRRSLKVDSMVGTANHLVRRVPFINAAWEEYKGASVRRIAAAAIGGSTMSERHVPDEILPGIFISSYHTVMDEGLMSLHRIEAVVSCVGDFLQHPRHVDDDGNGEAMMDRGDVSDTHTSSSLQTPSRTIHGATVGGGRLSPQRRRSILSDGASTCSSVTSATALARIAGGEVDTLDDDDTVETDDVSYSSHHGVA